MSDLGSRGQQFLYSHIQKAGLLLTRLFYEKLTRSSVIKYRVISKKQLHFIVACWCLKTRHFCLIFRRLMAFLRLLLDGFSDIARGINLMLQINEIKPICQNQNKS